MKRLTETIEALEAQGLKERRERECPRHDWQMSDPMDTEVCSLCQATRKNPHALVKHG